MTEETKDLADVQLPVNRLKDALPHLRRPFAPEAIKFRPAGGGIVAYVDARVVIERLNAVTGANWTTEFEPFPGGKQIVCHLAIQGVVRSDVGTMGTGSAVDPVKAGYSDALKRAAVHFGVGVSVYALKRIKQSDLPNGSIGQDKAITPAGETWLRRGYRRWLEAQGAKDFGPPLSHGDVEGAVGDPEAAPSPPGEAEAEKFYPEPDELRGVAIESRPEYFDLLAEIVKLYSDLTTEQRKGLGPAKFKANLKAAGGSEDDLRKLKATLEERKK